MSLRVLFFGRLRDLAGAGEIAIAGTPADVGALRALIGAQNPQLGAALAEPSVRVAVDQSFAEGDAPLLGAREVAFMPPLSGG